MTIGNKTASIYGLIRDGKYQEVIRILTQELQQTPRSRAALSLLAYSYYQSQDFEAAARMYATLHCSPIINRSLITNHQLHSTRYESLVKLCPEVQEYKVYHAQSLYKASLYPEAAKAAVQIDDPQFSQRVRIQSQ